jgi:hypothetical protein
VEPPPHSSWNLHSTPSQILAQSNHRRVSGVGGTPRAALRVAAESTLQPFKLVLEPLGLAL